MNCPICGEELEHMAGDYETGVVAPDGYREHHWEEGFHCAHCENVFEESDLEDETDNGYFGYLGDPEEHLREES